MPATAPAKTPPVARGRGTFPRHLTRYPDGLIPRAGRARGHSVFWYVWLGSHPVLLLITIVINLYLLAVLVAWIALVTVAWLLWTAAVGAWWLASMPFRRTR